MNCPRCGEIMYGSVCPRCGNVVLNDRESRVSARNNQNSSPQRTLNNRVLRRDDDVKFMDNNSGKAIKTPRKKSSGINFNLLKLALVVLVVLCAVLFFKYNSVSSQLAEAQNTINTQNESIKAKDQEINDLKAAQTKAAEEDANSDENADSEDSSAPTVEFDENGNVINIDENSSSNSSDDNSEEKSEYKSGDTYTVKDGDNGSIICNRIYGKYSEELWEKLLSANGMTTSSSYHPGDELKIP